MKYIHISMKAGILILLTIALSACGSSSSDDQTSSETPTQGVWNVDEEVVSLRLLQRNALEDGNGAVVSMRLEKRPSQDVVVGIRLEDTVRGTFVVSSKTDPSATTLTFTPQNWRIYQSLQIASQQDSDALEGSTIAELIVMSNTDPNYEIDQELARFSLIQLDAEQQYLYAPDINTTVNKTIGFQVAQIKEEVLPVSAQGTDQIILGITLPDALNLETSPLNSDNAPQTSDSEEMILLGTADDLPLTVSTLSLKAVSLAQADSLDLTLYTKAGDNAELVVIEAYTVRVNVTSTLPEFSLSLTQAEAAELSIYEQIQIQLATTSGEPVEEDITILLNATDQLNADLSSRFFGWENQIIVRQGQSSASATIIVADNPLALDSKNVIIKADLSDEMRRKATIDEKSNQDDVLLASKNEGLSPPNTLSFSANQLVFKEGEDVTITVRHQGSFNSAAEFVINLEQSDFLESNDFRIIGELSGSLELGATHEITIEALNDRLSLEENEALTLSLSTTSLFAEVEQGQQNIILNIQNKAVPEIYFSAPGTEIPDGLFSNNGYRVYETANVTAMTFSVELNEPREVATDFVIAWEGDVSESDFEVSVDNTPVSFEFTDSQYRYSNSIAASQTSFVFTVAIKQDDLLERDERLILILSATDSNNVDVTQGRTRLNLLVAENDLPVISIRADSSTLNKGQSSSITVSIDRTPFQAFDYELRRSELSTLQSEWTMSNNLGSLESPQQSVTHIVTIADDEEFNDEAKTLIFQLVPRNSSSLSEMDQRLSTFTFTISINPDPERYQIGFSSNQLSVFEDSGLITTDQLSIITSSASRTIDSDSIIVDLDIWCVSGCDPDTQDYVLASNLITLTSTPAPIGLRIRDDSNWQAEQRYTISMRVTSQSDHLAEVVTQNLDGVYPSVELIINGPNDIPELEWSISTPATATQINSQTLEATPGSTIKLDLRWAGNQGTPLDDGVSVSVLAGSGTTLASDLYNIVTPTLSFARGDQSKEFTIRLDEDAAHTQSLVLSFLAQAAEVARITIKPKDLFSGLFDNIQISSALSDATNAVSVGKGRLVRTTFSTSVSTQAADSYALSYSVPSSSNKSFLNGLKLNLSDIADDNVSISTVLPSHLIDFDQSFSILRTRDGNTSYSRSITNNQGSLRDDELIVRYTAADATLLGNHVALDSNASTLLAAAPGSGHYLQGIRTSTNQWTLELKDGSAPKKNIAVAISPNGEHQAFLSAVEVPIPSQEDDSAPSQEDGSAPSQEDGSVPSQEDDSERSILQYHFSALSDDSECTVATDPYNTQIEANSASASGEFGSIYFMITNSGSIIAAFDNPIHQLLQYDICNRAENYIARTVDLKDVDTSSVKGPIDINGMDIASETEQIHLNLYGEFLSPDSSDLADQSCLLLFGKDDFENFISGIGDHMTRCDDPISNTSTSTPIFGQVSLSGNGQTVVLATMAGPDGALARNTNLGGNFNDITVFSESSLTGDTTEWNRDSAGTGLLTSSTSAYGPDYRNYFGYAMDLSDDGTVLAVSGRKDRLKGPIYRYTNDNFDDTISSSQLRGSNGSTYGGISVYLRIDGSWRLVSEVTASFANTDGSSLDSLDERMRFGSGSADENLRYRQIALSKHGDVMVVGASGYATSATSEKGAVYIY